MKTKFLTYGMLSMLLVASSCKRQNDEASPGQEPNESLSQNDPGTWSATPTDQELLRLPELLIKTPVKKTVTAEGDELLQRDMTHYLNATILQKNSSTQSNDHGHDHKDAQLAVSLNRPHPSVKSLQKYFNEAAKEFNVPVELLMAIGQVQSNWTQVSESMYGSWGITGIIENQFTHQITEAAAILKVSPQQIKDDAKTNIRAAAALLAKYQQGTSANNLEDWFEATKKVTGLTDAMYSEQLAQRFYDLIAKGSKSVTLWGEIINIAAVRVDISHKIKEAGNKQTASYSKGGATTQAIPTSATVSAAEYPGAIENYAPSCNYGSRNGATIGYYFVHYIGTGTYQGTISWFKNCDSNVSSHYVIRNSDGQVTQMVREANKAFTQGVAFYNERGVATEHEALASNLSMWYSDPMLTSGGNLAANVCERRGIPKVRAVAAPGINGHSDVNSGTVCPNMTQDVWNKFMAKVNPVAPPPPVVNTPGTYQIDVNHTNQITKPGWNGLLGTEGNMITINGNKFTLFGAILGTRDRATTGEVSRDFAFNEGPSTGIGIRMESLPAGTYNVSTWNYDPNYPGLVNVEFREAGLTATTQVKVTGKSLTDAAATSFQIVVVAGKNYEIIIRENSLEDRSRFNGIQLVLAP
ncbi:MAG TPA: N-acetylmuramoyl-L-alanine amidase [Sphingobacteriaceae bacterium]|nr:N-acetylmuramoyl-L-alanine amidase [Sphingobacteriaceae bacterium]